MSHSSVVGFSLAIALASSLSSQSFDFAAAAQYSKARNGHALVIMHRGKIVHESYANGWSAGQSHRLASGTKSFTGVLLAIAVDDGLLKFDEKVSSIITEWRGLPTKGSLTYRQLIGLHSGIDGGQTGSTPTYAGSLGSPVIGTPGSVFSYGPIPFQVFGEALRRKLAARSPSMTVADYLQTKLLTPMGLQVPFWREFASGQPHLPSGAFLRATEWIKFAEMVRMRGFYNGQQVVSAAALDNLFRNGPTSTPYGIGWWLPTAGSLQPTDLVMAKGAGKQRLYVLPSQELVVARFGESTGWSDNDFLVALMPASYTNFGAGCRGTAGIPRLRGDLTRPPVYGRNAGFRVDRIPSAANGMLFLGFSKQSHLGLTLPLSLDLLGMPGCRVHCSLDVSKRFTSSSGVAVFALPLPRDNSLLGNDFYTQAVIFDTQANRGGLTVSNAVGARIGLR